MQYNIAATNSKVCASNGAHIPQANTRNSKTKSAKNSDTSLTKIPNFWKLGKAEKDAKTVPLKLKENTDDGDLNQRSAVDVMLAQHVHAHATINHTARYSVCYFTSTKVQILTPSHTHTHTHKASTTPP